MGRSVVLALAVLAACSPSPRAGPVAAPATPSPSPFVSPPVAYFNLSEEDALDYLEHLDERAQAALHDGSLGDLHDIYTDDGDARREAAATIIRDFQKGWVNRTEIEVLSTEILKISSTLAVFRQVRLVRPCIYTDDDMTNVTPDDRFLRQVVVRYMAEEYLNWRLDRDVIERSRFTGDRVTDCP